MLTAHVQTSLILQLVYLSTPSIPTKLTSPLLNMSCSILTGPKIETSNFRKTSPLTSKVLQIQNKQNTPTPEVCSAVMSSNLEDVLYPGAFASRMPSLYQQLKLSSLYSDWYTDNFYGYKRPFQIASSSFLLSLKITALTQCLWFTIFRSTIEQCTSTSSITSYVTYINKTSENYN